MIHAYDEVYLDDAMECLGAAVEYAVLSCNMDGQEFLDLFVASGVADEFGRGNVRFISGMSGIELARHILRTCGMEVSEYIDALHIDYPPEYWCGWILAHYQWHSGKTFATILRQIKFEMLMDVYGVLHEADPSKAVEVFEQIMSQKEETNLAYYRKMKGLSQSQLANASGISVRSIQLFEQRKSNINNAQYNHLSSIAKALGCAVEDLLE